MIPSLNTIAVVAMTLAQGPVRTGAFVAKVGPNVVGLEAYRFDGSVLTAQITLVGQGLHLTTETRYDRALAPERFHVTGRSAPDGPALQELEVTLGDSARWTVTARGQSQHGVTAISAPSMVLQNLQFSLVAVALLRYDRAKGGAQQVNAWLPQGAAVVPVTIVVTGDSGTVSVAGQDMEVHMDRSGWLTRARLVAQNLTVEWQAEAPAAPAARPAPRTGTADTVPPSAAKESPFTFQSGALKIAGTLTVPAQANGGVPVAILVAGSGPTDRDGNSRLGVHGNTYAQIAWRLAERGIATLRYDKRGLGESGKQFDMAQTTFDDFANDAAAGVRALAADRRFSRVVILGHSEGAGLAVRAAASGAPVAGVALLAGVGRPIDVVLREQLASQFDSADMAKWDRAWAAYLRGEPTGDLPTGMQGLVVPINRKFLQTSVAYKPAEEIARIRPPVLIVQGGFDIQVSVPDARALAAAKPSARLVIVADANHLFKRVPSADRGAQQVSYLDPTLPVVPELIEALAGWIGGLR